MEFYIKKRHPQKCEIPDYHSGDAKDSSIVWRNAVSTGVTDVSKVSLHHLRGQAFLQDLNFQT
jgi:hypothetical protein